MKERLLKLPEVIQRVAFSRSTIYEKMRLGEFPEQVRLGVRAVAWREADIDNWIEALILNKGRGGTA